MNLLQNLARFPLALLQMASLAMPASALAQEGQAGPGHAPQAQASYQNARAGKLVGLKVADAGKAELGEVTDLLFDWDAGRLQHLVVALRGQPGPADALAVYPVTRFQLAASEDQLVLSGDARAHADASAPPSGADPRLIGIDRVLGAPIEDHEGRKIGAVNEVVVGLPDGRLRYLAMDPVDASDMKNRLVLLPLNALHASEPAAAGWKLRLAPSMPAGQLAYARTVNKDQWPRVNSAFFKAEMDSYVLTSSLPEASGGAPFGDAGSGAGASGAMQAPDASGGRAAAPGGRNR